MKPYIGWMFTGTLAMYLLSFAIPFAVVPQAVCAWLVPLVMWSSFARGIQRQSLVLAASGIGIHLLAVSRGAVFPWREVLTLNLPMLAMFVAVSFLALANTRPVMESLPKGRGAVVQTAVGTHLLASVINISVLFVFGDRLQVNGRLKNNQQIILARSFCAAAWWSPFFVATGVALTYAPGMSLHQTLIPGIIMSIIGICFSVVEVGFFRKEEFSGYPFRPDSLVIPFFLAGLVLLTHFAVPRINVLSIICVVAPAGAVAFMKERPRLSTLHRFIKTRLNSTGSQFSLFLAAGIFSTGIKSILRVYPDLLSLHSAGFTPELFSIILGIVIFIGFFGIHPVVSISVLSPLLLPLNPDPSQLGFLFLSSWAISTGTSPLSGVGLALLSRYQASAVQILKSNWHYALAMWGLASIGNMVFFGS